jgi:hypothetical protein
VPIVLLCPLLCPPNTKFYTDRWKFGYTFTPKNQHGPFVREKGDYLIAE